VIISLGLLSNAYPQDKPFEGEVSLKGIWLGLEAKEGGRAKFTEYRDLKEDGGFYGRAKLNLDKDKYFLNFDAGDFGYDTQYITKSTVACGVNSRLIYFTTRYP